MEYLVISIVAIIMLVAGLNGYKRGFVNIALTLAASLVAILLAAGLSKPVAAYIKNNTPLYSNIEKQMNQYVSKYLEDSMELKTTELTDEMLEKLPVPDAITKILSENNTKDVIKDLGSKNVGEYISAQLAGLIVTAIVYMGLFILFSVVLRILISMLDIIAKLPVVKEVNQLLGLAAGLIEGLLIVWVCALLVTAVAGTDFGQEIMKQIGDNSFLTFIYQNNPLMKILK